MRPGSCAGAQGAFAKTRGNAMRRSLQWRKTNPCTASIRSSKRGRNDTFWLNIGVAFYHRDGHGLNVMLQAMPLDGRLVLRRYDEDPPKAVNGAQTSGTEPEAAPSE